LKQVQDKKNILGNKKWRQEELNKTILVRI